MIETEHTLSGLLTELRRISEGYVSEAIDAKAAGNLHLKTVSEHRAQYARRLVRRLEARSTRQHVPKCVFVSYSKNTGERQFSTVRRLLSGSGWDVATGFDRQKGDQANVLTRVLRNLGRATVFLGIFTKEYSQGRGKKRGVPSIWTVEEKGMALSRELPIVLLVHDSVNDDYWKKTTPERVHFRFTDKDFAIRAREAMTLLEEQYERRRDLFLLGGTDRSPG